MEDYKKVLKEFSNRLKEEKNQDKVKKEFIKEEVIDEKLILEKDIKEEIPDETLFLDALSKLEEEKIDDEKYSTTPYLFTYNRINISQEELKKITKMRIEKIPEPNLTPEEFFPKIYEEDFFDEEIRELPRKKKDLVPQDILDLHNLSKEESLKELKDFITKANRKGLNIVMVITGKGFHSKKGVPIIRKVVARWLQKDGGKFVKEFYYAPVKYGGHGAFYIILKKKKIIL